MHHFGYTDQKLHCEAVDLTAVARLYGTPTQVYSAATMTDNYHRLQQAFPGPGVKILYAVKANSNLAVLRHLGNLGAGFDLVSGGELRRVMAAGLPLTASVLAGVGKTEEEIELALENGIFAIHVESEPELVRIDHVAGRLGKQAPVALRINPAVAAATHTKIATARADSKFGVPLARAPAVFEALGRLKHVAVKGVQVHLGSQLTTAAPYLETVDKLSPWLERWRRDQGLEYFSIGGGLAIAYDQALASGAAGWWESQPPDRRPLTPEEFGRELTPALARLGLKILIEPGRMLVGNAGVLLTRVEYLKRGGRKNFLVVDAGMNDLIRPALYGARHEIVPVLRDTTRPSLVADVVGPVCESGDCFYPDCRLQEVGEGELLAIMSTGAYGFSMSSRFNSRPLVAEVLVRDRAFELIQARETFAQMIANERIPAFLT